MVKKFTFQKCLGPTQDLMPSDVFKKNAFYSKKRVFFYNKSQKIAYTPQTFIKSKIGLIKILRY